MDANCDRTCPLLRRVLVAAGAAVLGLSLSAAAQTASAPVPTATLQSDPGSSSSTSADLQAYLNPNNFLSGISGMKAEPSPSGVASPQYGGQRQQQYPGYESRMSHLAFEAGGGFTAPIGNDTHGFETWGYNLGVGAGWNFTKHLGALIEYQFDKQKIPGATIALVGAQGGNINTWSFTLDPVYYLPTGHTTGAYLTGGLGFYRKVTNFTDLVQGQQCYYFCYYVTQPVTVAHFSSNQLGANVGLGLYWKAFGQDSNGKLFAEAHYVWVDSPTATKTQDGEGTEGLIPVTVGIRF